MTAGHSQAGILVTSGPNAGTALVQNLSLLLFGPPCRPI